MIHKGVWIVNDDIEFSDNKQLPLKLIDNKTSTLEFIRIKTCITLAKIPIKAKTMRWLWQWHGPWYA